MENYEFASLFMEFLLFIMIYGKNNSPLALLTTQAISDPSVSLVTYLCKRELITRSQEKTEKMNSSSDPYEVWDLRMY